MSGADRPRGRAGAIAAIARADLLERTRAYGFLVFTGLMLWIGYGTYTGTVHVTLGEFVGTWNSAWAGGMMALVTNVVLTLVGFWFVRHSVERDVRTRVGPILAATPLSRLGYVAGKAVSHFAVLALMALVLFAAAAAIQLAHGGGAGFAPGPLLTPYVVIVLPSLWLVAALAALFETTPILDGPVGNGVWLIVWTTLLVVGVGNQGNAPSPLGDAFGVGVIQGSMWHAILAQHPHLTDAGSLNVNIGGADAATRRFTWGGLALTPALVGARLAWCAIAAAIVALAALPFHRFDPDRVPRARRAESTTAPRAARERARAALALGRVPLPPGLVAEELRVQLAGAGAWWTAVAAGAWIASALVPFAAARAIVLPALWLWALPRWSGLGARETRDATFGLVFTARGATRRVTLAGWVAGAILAASLALPVAVRLAGVGDAAGLVGLATGAMFLPALALALGAVSGSARLFEVIYVLLWYLGPMNRAAALDYTGALPGSMPALWAVLAAFGPVVAWAARTRRLRA